MQYKNTLVACVLTFFLAGCANTGPAKPTTKVSGEQVINLKSGGYVKTQSFEFLESDTQTPSDNELRVITKGNTTGAVAAKTASFVVTALFGGVNSQSTFTKHQLKGSKIGSVENPSASYFLPKMNEIIADDLHVDNGADYRNHPLQMSYSNFYLVYSELSGSSLYELTYTMSVSIPSSGEYNLDCSFISGGHTLEDWSANGYQKVKDTIKSKLDGCLVEFSNTNKLASLASSLDKAQKESKKI